MSSDGNEFDRIKPPDRRLMERPSGPRLDAPEADGEGRAALFTSGPGRDRARQRERSRQEPAGRAERARQEEAGDQRRRLREGGAGEADGLAVHCSRCDATAPLDPGAALRAVLPLFLVAPWKDHPVFAVCPACRHRAWLRVDR